MDIKHLPEAKKIADKCDWLTARIADLKSPQDLDINWGNRSVAISKLDLCNTEIREMVIHKLEFELKLQTIRAHDIGLII